MTTGAAKGRKTSGPGQFNPDRLVQGKPNPKAPTKGLSRNNGGTKR